MAAWPRTRADRRQSPPVARPILLAAAGAAAPLCWRGARSRGGVMGRPHRSASPARPPPRSRCWSSSAASSGGASPRGPVDPGAKGARGFLGSRGRGGRPRARGARHRLPPATETTTIHPEHLRLCSPGRRSVARLGGSTRRRPPLAAATCLATGYPPRGSRCSSPSSAPRPMAALRRRHRVRPAAPRIWTRSARRRRYGRSCGSARAAVLVRAGDVEGALS